MSKPDNSHEYFARCAGGFEQVLADELRGLRSTDDVFGRKMDEAQVETYLAGWKDAVRRTL